MERTFTVTLNGKEVKAQPGQMILELCEEAGVDIPTLCYNPDLSLHGGCSLCLVDVKGAKSLVRACSMPVQDGMEIETHTERIIGARKLALELLLSDHVGDCRPPCQLACPARGDVKGYVNLAAEGNYKAAQDILHQNITMPASIGRVCPAPCEEKCRRNFVDDEAVSIREIKRFIGDWAISQDELGEIPQIRENGKKVAIVGGGPAGLSAAYFLRLKGYAVTLYEKEDKLGGMMRYGIPDYRLPQPVLDREVKWLVDHGINVRLNTALGRDITLDSLKKENDAVVLAMGCWSSMPMRVFGEDLEGVQAGIEFLYKVNTGQDVYVGKHVAVIGGGNTAMDAARSALRLGAEKVSVIYRRSREEMPAEDVEIEEAIEEGVEFIFLAAPKSIEGAGKVERIVCEKMVLGEPDASGRRKPIPTGETFTLDVRTVIAAIGQRPDLSSLPENIHDGKRIVVNDHFATPIEGVFVCGDQKTGPDIAIAAIGAGHWTAESVHHYISEGIPHRPFECDVVRDDLGPEDFMDQEKQPREKPRILDAAERFEKPFEEFNLSLSEDQVRNDGNRCMKCGCPDIYECKLRAYGVEYEASPDEFPKEFYARPDRPEEENPFYVRNMDKCVQCGVCVRVCDEHALYHAIDFQKRGIETYVAPGIDRGIDNSDCVNCGLCVQMCPTGALTERTQHGITRPEFTKTVKTICPYCAVGCEIMVHVDTKTGRIDNVTTDFDSETSLNKGRICVKGRFGWHFVHHKDRLTTPLIKEGEDFREATWEEALDKVSRKLLEIKDKNGPDTLGFISSAKCTNEENYLMQRFAREVIGTNNIDHCARLCHSPTVKGLGETLGSAAMTNDFESIKQADVIMIIGSNTTENHPVLATWIKERKIKGKTSLIVCDPREIELKQYADVPIRHNSGSDVAFLNGMINIIIEEGLYDDEFVRKHVDGFEDLKKTVASYTPEKVANITGIDGDTLRNAARLYAKGPNSAIFYSMGITQHKYGTDNVRALANLALLCGMLGRQGTGINPLRGHNNVQGACDVGCMPEILPGYINISSEREKAQARVKEVLGGELPPNPGKSMVKMIEAALDGSLKGLYIMGENPMVSDPDTNKQREALENLEFLVVQDLFLTETAMLADVVLPAASWAEREGTFTNTSRAVQRIRKAVESPGEAKPDWWIITEIAKACGASWNYDSPRTVMEEIRRFVPQYGGITYERLEEGPLMWPCPDENHPGTPILYTREFPHGKARFAPCDWQKPHEEPDAEYPFIATIGRSLYHFHTGTMTRRSPSGEYIGSLYVEINPADAERLQIKNGDKVRVSSRRGVVEGRAIITDRVPLSMVFLPFHFGEQPANALTASVFDEEAETPAYKINAVKVEKS